MDPSNAQVSPDSLAKLPTHWQTSSSLKFETREEEWQIHEKRLIAKVVNQVEILIISARKYEGETHSLVN